MNWGERLSEPSGKCCSGHMSHLSKGRVTTGLKQTAQPTHFLIPRWINWLSYYHIPICLWDHYGLWVANTEVMENRAGVEFYTLSKDQHTDTKVTLQGFLEWNHKLCSMNEFSALINPAWQQNAQTLKSGFVFVMCLMYDWCWVQFSTTALGGSKEPCMAPPVPGAVLYHSAPLS